MLNITIRKITQSMNSLIMKAVFHHLFKITLQNKCILPNQVRGDNSIISCMLVGEKTFFFNITHVTLLYANF